MADEPAGEPPARSDQAHITTWQRLDQTMPALLVSWAALGLLAQHLDVENGAPLTALLAAVVFTWATLAVTASVLAVRHAWATRGLPRMAWSGVPAVLALALPFAIAFLGEQGFTEGGAEACSTGLFPAKVTDTLFDWVPWPGYAWVPVATALVGLACLATASTRRPGAWILASTLLGLSFWVTGFSLITNHCD